MATVQTQQSPVGWKIVGTNASAQMYTTLFAVCFKSNFDDPWIELTVFTH